MSTPGGNEQGNTGGQGSGSGNPDQGGTGNGQNTGGGTGGQSSGLMIDWGGKVNADAPTMLTKDKPVTATYASSVTKATITVDDEGNPNTQAWTKQFKFGPAQPETIKAKISQGQQNPREVTVEVTEWPGDVPYLSVDWGGRTAMAAPTTIKKGSPTVTATYAAEVTKATITVDDDNPDTEAFSKVVKFDGGQNGGQQPPQDSQQPPPNQGDQPPPNDGGGQPPQDGSDGGQQPPEQDGQNPPNEGGSDGGQPPQEDDQPPQDGGSGDQQPPQNEGGDSTSPPDDQPPQDDGQGGDTQPTPPGDDGQPPQDQPADDGNPDNPGDGGMP